jgi:transcriptional regulator with XRE-family HTH domain
VAERAKSTAVPWADWLGERMRVLGFEGNSDLARATGVPDSVISRWRTTGTTPSVGQRRRLQSALQMSLVELLVAAGHLTAEEAGITSFTVPTRLARGTRDAISQDRELDDDLRHLLEVQYDAMLAIARARRPTPTSAADQPGTAAGSG